MVYINHGFEAAVAQVHMLLCMLLLRVSCELPALLRLVAFPKDQVFAYPNFTLRLPIFGINKTVRTSCRKNMLLGYCKAENKATIKMQLWKFVHWDDYEVCGGGRLLFQCVSVVTVTALCWCI